MNSHTLNIIKHINPKLTPDDIERYEMINQYDLFVELKNGEKYVYDTFTNTFRGFYPEGHELTDEEWKHAFRTRLRRMMQRRFITQEELAEKVGTSQVMISRYLTGKCVPSYIMLGKIAKTLGCSVDDFYYQYY